LSEDIFAPYISERQKANNLPEHSSASPHDMLQKDTSNYTSIDLFAEYLKSIGSAHNTVSPSEVSGNGDTLKPPDGQPLDLAVLGGSVVLPDFGVFPCDVYCKQGRVVSLSQGDTLPARHLISARGKMVLPGIIDPHVHMGIADSLASELQSETLSGLLGGITTAGLYLGADLANAENFDSIRSQVERLSCINILPHFVVASHEQIAMLPLVVRTLGIRSFKVYLHGVEGLIESKDDAFVVDVMTALKATGERCVLCVHTENHSLVQRAAKKARSRFGDDATLSDWAETHPEIAEEEAVMRIAYFAEKFRQLSYIVHLSTAGAVEKLREIRKTNPYVLCETVSPYLMVDPERTRGFAAKMEPPIRGGRHSEALWQGLADGVIDTIGTDNVSWNLGQKKPGSLWEALPGYPAMATHLPSVLTGGYMNRGFDLTALVSKMTSAPAKAFGIYPQKGTLLPGSDADMVIVDLQSIRKVDSKKLHSRSEYSIYEDRSFTGWPSFTIVGGQVAAADGEAVGGAKGRLLLRRV
jgi:dihydropyrimidinase